MGLFKVKVGEFDLIESGSIITMKDANIHFFIQDLEYEFRFTKAEGNELKINIVSNTGKKLVVELQNFDNSLGAGNINPMPMGTVNGNDMYLLYRVTQLDEGGKTMHYSWLSKPHVNNNNESHE